METEPECFPQEHDPDEDRPDGDIDQRECFEALAQLGLDEDSMAVSYTSIRAVCLRFCTMPGLQL